MSLQSNLLFHDQRLGDFEVGREIGRGGMGVVYEARQTSLNRRVALKVLAAGMGLTVKAVERFHREAEAAAKLHHTNIVPIYATGEENGTHYYAMELIEGPSLDQVIRQLRQTPAASGQATVAAEAQPDPQASTDAYVTGTGSSSSGFGSGTASLTSGSGYFDTAARMIAEVADALEHAHAQGVIHRDIKPSNLLLAPTGRLSVNDFGLARMLEQPGMTITGEMVGTPRYMSPEQITAGRIPVDHRTDIYSLGATLYEVLTLRPPFSGEQRDQILAQIIQKEPTLPRKLNPRVPVDLETICLKAMDKDPDRRYQSAGQMAEDLRRYVNRFAILARRAGPVERLRKWVQRRPGLAAAVAVSVLFVLVAAGLGYRLHLLEQNRRADAAKHQVELLEEKRRSALDKAILACRMEDFDGARQAIHEAEKLGCSPGEVRMLQGQLELYQGRLDEAIANLTQSVNLLPKSVAAWSMLAVALSNAGRVTEFNRALTEATRLEPVTPEDFLFRGHAESTLDSERGLRTLDEAVRRRPSALARLIRTEVLRMCLLDNPDVEQAKLAMEDVQSIKRQFSESPMIGSLAISVHLTCYHLFGDLKEPTLQKAALDEGWKDARGLARFPNSTKAVLSRWIFLDEIGQSEQGVAELRRAWVSTKDLYLGYNYAIYSYQTGNFDEAARTFEQNRGETVEDLFGIIAFAEGPDGYARASKLYQEVAARDLQAWDLFNSQLILRFLGRKDEAVEVSRKFLTRPNHFPPVRQESFRRALEYCAGQRTAESLLASMQASRGDLCNAHLCIALTALADGNRSKAREHLQRCIATRHFEFLPYDMSKLLLSRMDRDARWPAWVKSAP